MNALFITTSLSGAASFRAHRSVGECRRGLRVAAVSSKYVPRKEIARSFPRNLERTWTFAKMSARKSIDAPTFDVWQEFVASFVTSRRPPGLAVGQVRL
jgi:hypothetical protein